jgi:hypothetical protein
VITSLCFMVSVIFYSIMYCASQEYKVFLLVQYFRHSKSVLILTGVRPWNTCNFCLIYRYFKIVFTFSVIYFIKALCSFLCMQVIVYSLNKKFN